MAILRSPGGSGRAAPVIRKPPPPQGFVSTAQPKPAPRPVAAAVQRRVAAPVAPRVVVPNNQGNYSKPRPVPTVQPGPIQGAGGGPRGQEPTARPVQPRATIPGVGPVNNAPSAATEPVVQPPPPALLPLPPVENATPDLDSYLGTDTEYQGQLGEFGSALTGFAADQGRSRSGNATSFAQRLRQLQDSQQSDEGNLMEDFASRGLSKSGVYADALTNLQGQYGQSRTNLEAENTGFEADLMAQLADFQAQQQAAMQDARAQAIARRAATYGLG